MLYYVISITSVEALDNDITFLSYIKIYKQSNDVFYCIIDADNMWLEEKIQFLSLYVINSLGSWRPS